jgi:hypothetical protein
MPHFSLYHHHDIFARAIALGLIFRLTRLSQPCQQMRHMAAEPYPAAPSPSQGTTEVNLQFEH